MFVSCALIPILALAVTAYSRVTVQLRRQAADRLWQASKTHGLSITEHLLIADEQLRLVQSTLAEGLTPSLDLLPPALIERNRDLFSGLAVVHQNTVTSARGECRSEFWATYINDGHYPQQIDSRLTEVNDGSKWPRVVLSRMVSAQQGQAYCLIGVVNHAFLWGEANGSVLPPATEFCVWNATGDLLFSSLGNVDTPDFLRIHEAKTASTDLSTLMIHGHQFMAAYWSPFFKAHFESPHWTISVMEAESHILEPLYLFRLIFPLIVLLTLGFVILLSIRTIRSNLTPINLLMEGARQVACHKFDHRVQVTSKDEFRDLADAFNHMTIQMELKFKELKARAELDRSILSATVLEQIISTFLNHLIQFFPHRIAAVGVIAPNGNLEGCSYIQTKESLQKSPVTRPFYFSAHDRDFFTAHPKWVFFEANDVIPQNLSAMMGRDGCFLLVLPIWVNEKIFGLVSVGVAQDRPLSEQDMVSLRNVADHLTVGFTNCDLINTLEMLNVGTLQALARTVDANSPWTAGHSMRVTHLAVEIAKAMGLDAKAQEEIKYAGYLHDIGKIGIPTSILNKAAKLTDEEYNLIKKHPSIGANILSPIKVYADLIPIVEQHHERYDGKGYPFGLSKSGIHPLARVLAVADALDAMVSDRPYRRGLPIKKAIENITSEAGQQFDPQVVAVFGQMMKNTNVSEWFEISPKTGPYLPMSPKGICVPSSMKA